MSEKLKLYSGNTEQIQEKTIENGAMYVDTEAKSLSFDIADDRITIESSEEYDDTELKDAIAEQGKAIQEIEKVNQEQDVNITYVQEQIAEINTSIDDIDGEIETLTDGLETVSGNVATLTESVSKDAERITALEQKPDVEPFDPSEINEAISALQSKDTEIDGTLSTLGTLATIDTDGNANHFLNGEGEWVDTPAGSGSSSGGSSGNIIEGNEFGKPITRGSEENSVFSSTVIGNLGASTTSVLVGVDSIQTASIKNLLDNMVKANPDVITASLQRWLGQLCGGINPGQLSSATPEFFACDGVDATSNSKKVIKNDDGTVNWDDTYIYSSSISNTALGVYNIPVNNFMLQNSSKNFYPEDTINTKYFPYLPVWLGGTGAYTGEQARTNLAVPYLADFNDLVARVEALETANASLLQANNTLKAQNASLIADIQFGKTKRVYENWDFDEEAYKERIKPTVEEEIEVEE